MSLSIDGLVSGLDTTGLISALMTAEALPQTRLKTQLSTAQSAASAYRSINTKVDALRSAAEELAKTTTWTAAKATSSAPSVAVAVTGTPQTGQLSFTVESVAAAHSVVSDTRWAATTATFGSGSLTVTTGATTTTVTVGGTGTLADAVSAINAQAPGLSATAVRMGPDSYALMVTAKATGEAARFELAGAGALTTVTTGSDARLRLGTATTGTTSTTVTSPSNTFADLLPGGTLTVSERTATPVTINVTADPDAVAAKVKGFVDAANAALAEIEKYADNTSGSTAVLKGDFALRQLAGEILGAVSAAVGADGSPARAGVELTRTGTVSFDQTAFIAALSADPARTRRLFAGTLAEGTTPAVDGISQRLQTLAKRATDTTTGTLSVLARGRDDLAKDLKGRIEDWDLRLAARKEILARQFTAMETALRALQSQSSWLAGQLASLPSSS
ncbi:flagellar filament capping protein FliD [Geodermatophilus sp. SYSU D00758]